MLDCGDPAPDFSLPDQNGNYHTLSGYRGNWVVLHFFDFNEIDRSASSEVGSFNQKINCLGKLGAVVLGVSGESVATLSGIHKTKGLGFPLLSDPDLKVIPAYGALRGLPSLVMGIISVHRHTYLINPEGKVAKVWYDFPPYEHALEVCRSLEKRTGAK